MNSSQDTSSQALGCPQDRGNIIFEALPEGAIAEAAKRGEVDLSLVSVDSTTARAHHDAAGMHLGRDLVAALEKAAEEQKGASWKDDRSRTP